jgi:hypothetical protein
MKHLQLLEPGCAFSSPSLGKAFMVFLGLWNAHYYSSYSSNFYFSPHPSEKVVLKLPGVLSIFTICSFSLIQ